MKIANLMALKSANDLPLIALCRSIEQRQRSGNAPFGRLR
jgi:hypothetical protein